MVVWQKSHHSKLEAAKDYDAHLIMNDIYQASRFNFPEEHPLTELLEKYVKSLGEKKND